MGKGGTKFESEAIGVRSGRNKGGVSFKDIKKDMQVRQVTTLNQHVLCSLLGSFLVELATELQNAVRVLKDFSLDPSPQL